MSKIVFLGNSGVGKSSILRRFKFDDFQLGKESTIGCEFFAKIVTINGIEKKLLLWDTAGQEVFRSFTQNFLRGSKVIVIVYDITNEKSINEIDDWLKESSKQSQKPKIILVGNKIDLPTSIDYQPKINGIIESNTNIELRIYDFGIVSAKNGKNVKELFDFIATKLDIPVNSSPTNSINLGDSNNNSGYTCCYI